MSPAFYPTTLREEIVHVTYSLANLDYDADQLVSGKRWDVQLLVVKQCVIGRLVVADYNLGMSQNSGNTVKHLEQVFLSLACQRILHVSQALCRDIYHLATHISDKVLDPLTPLSALVVYDGHVLFEWQLTHQALVP